MKTVDDPIFDGPANLIASVRAVTALSGRASGVAVMMGETLHAARRVVKSHTESFAAFTSTHGGPLGHLEASGIQLYAQPRERERIDTDRLESRVDLVTACVGSDARFLRCAIDGGARGIVVEALGAGNVPPAMLDGVAEAVAAGLTVVVSSRCGSGPTGARYGYAGGGATLRDAGAIFSGGLPAPKARIKLMALLGAHYGPAAVREAFERSDW